MINKNNNQIPLSHSLLSFVAMVTLSSIGTIFVMITLSGLFLVLEDI